MRFVRSARATVCVPYTYGVFGQVYGSLLSTDQNNLHTRSLTTHSSSQDCNARIRFDCIVIDLTRPSSVYYLYSFVRRPRLILDFSLTLLFNHLVLTTYYSAAIPTSLFFWAIMCVSTAGTVIFAEQLCVKREMSEGLVVAPARDGNDSMEMGSLLRED